MLYKLYSEDKVDKISVQNCLENYLCSINNCSTNKNPQKKSFIEADGNLGQLNMKMSEFCFSL